jgi:hypothetical protein
MLDGAVAKIIDFGLSIEGEWVPGGARRGEEMLPLPPHTPHNTRTHTHTPLWLLVVHGNMYQRTHTPTTAATTTTTTTATTTTTPTTALLPPLLRHSYYWHPPPHSPPPPPRTHTRSHTHTRTHTHTHTQVLSRVWRRKYSRVGRTTTASRLIFGECFAVDL